MDYAIIKLGNKQHRVRDGETLVVDRLPTEAGKTFEPFVLLGDEKVTATVVAHERGPKIVVGKYRRRTGYKRHNGFRAATSRIEITIGAGTTRAAAKTHEPAKPETAEAAPEEPKVEAAAVEPAEVEAEPVEAEPVEAEQVEAEQVEAEQVGAPAAEAPAEPEPAEGEEEPADTEVPAGYADLTVAQVNAETKGWNVAELQAALAYEQEHQARKGAISALESALKKEEEEDEDGA